MDDFRNNNLYAIILWLLEAKKVLPKHINLTIVVIEQDRESKFKPYLKPGVDYIFAYNPGFFNRGWGFNIAYRTYPHADYYFFSDNDILLSIEDLTKIFSECFNFDAVNPYSNIYDTHEAIHPQRNNLAKFWNKQVSVSGLNNQKLIEKKRENTCFAGGIVGISSHGFELISGWDERFRGRGWEDYAFTAKINLFLPRTHTFEFDALHVWHPLETNTIRDINYSLNDEYGKYNLEDYVNLILVTAGKIGYLSKYHIEGNFYDGSIKNNDISDKILHKLFHTLNFPSYHLRAQSMFSVLFSLVCCKHKESSTINRYIYLNLCEQHQCYKCKHEDPPSCIPESGASR